MDGSRELTVPSVSGGFDDGPGGERRLRDPAGMQACIDAVRLDQLGMCPVLDELPGIEHEDPVSVLRSGEPVGNRDAGAAIEQEYPGVEITAVCGDFEEHLGKIPLVGRRLVVFLGSTIGNLTAGPRADFLAALADSLQPGDTLLLGTDLVKDVDRLVRAYDDSAGVTAAFNKNVLAVVNRELDADFDLDAFEHVARWNPDELRIEMRLRATSPQRVRIAGLDLTVDFAAGEEMLTEVSCKFQPDGVAEELAAAGLRRIAWWTDAAGDFGLSLAVK